VPQKVLPTSIGSMTRWNAAPIDRPRTSLMFRGPTCLSRSYQLTQAGLPRVRLARTATATAPIARTTRSCRIHTQLAQPTTAVHVVIPDQAASATMADRTALAQPDWEIWDFALGQARA
jgi:hypothetical protein